MFLCSKIYLKKWKTLAQWFLKGYTFKPVQKNVKTECVWENKNEIVNLCF